MEKSNITNNVRFDQIKGKRIILHDNGQPGPKIFRKVEIVDTSGKKRIYDLNKTKKGGFLFN